MIYPMTFPFHEMEQSQMVLSNQLILLLFSVNTILEKG